MVAQVNGVDLTNGSSYSCTRSGAVLDGCNPGYFEFPLAGIYPVDLTIVRNDGRRCQTRLDFNYPGDT